MPTRKPRNIRFWAWANKGLVRLTLRPGQSLTHLRGGPCDEGYSYKSLTWEHIGNGIERLWGRKSSDCDGRHSEYGADFSPIADLESQEAYPPEDYPGIRLPQWRAIASSQRDYFAEAMGY